MLYMSSPVAQLGRLPGANVRDYSHSRFDSCLQNELARQTRVLRNNAPNYSPRLIPFRRT